MKYDISKILIRIKLFIVIFLFVNIFSTYSMNFYQDINGVYCIKDDGFKATSEWITYDFESDGLLEYYYFDWDGFLLTDTYTPETTLINKEQHKQNYKTKNSIVGISAVIFVFILIFLLIIVILDAFNKSDFRGSYKHKKKQNSFWYTSSVNKSDVKKTEYEFKTQTDLIV